MGKFGSHQPRGKAAMTTNMRKIVRQNQLCGFLMALDGIAITWGALIQNLRCELGLTDEQVQKIIRVGDRYWEMVGEFKNEGMAPEEFAEYLEAKSATIRRSMTGARSRAEGAGFESLINSACEYYRTNGIADIEKTPEPMKPLGGADRSGRFLACYTKQAQPDYKGILAGGTAVTFEAKHTNSGKMGLDRVSSTQAACLSRTTLLGGVAFVLCSFGANAYYRVPWPVWCDMKNLFGRKYVTQDDLKAYRVRFAAPGVLLFLEGVNNEKR